MSSLTYQEWKGQVVGGIVREYGVSREIADDYGDECGWLEIYQTGASVEETLDAIAKEVVKQALGGRP